jgi:Lrp/AsnC family transcriptional regulator, leucine-responsive regulatory protein
LRFLKGIFYQFNYEHKKSAMASNDKLDKTDLKILKALQENSGISNLELSQKVGLSATPTFERVKKLEKANVIKGYHAEVDAKTLGIGIETFMLVSVAQARGLALEDFVEQVNKIDEIVECYHITGSSDYLFKIMTKDISSYEHLAMDRIRDIKEISNIQTLVILSTIKKSKIIPLDYGE